MDIVPVGYYPSKRKEKARQARQAEMDSDRQRNGHIRFRMNFLGSKNALYAVIVLTPTTRRLRNSNAITNREYGHGRVVPTGV
jgi:hypothetical protein